MGRPLAVGVVAFISLASPTVGAAATLTVNTHQDELVRGDGRCSLREAIEAVDAPSQRTGCGAVSRRSNVIELPAGRYALSIPAAGPDGDTSGDLTVTATAPVTIAGSGANTTAVDAGALGDRVLSVAGGARLTLTRLSVIGGRAPGGLNVGAGCSAGDGGGILNAGTLVLDHVTVAGNTAGAGGPGGDAGCGGGTGEHGGSGGGVYNQGRLTLLDSTVQGNAAGAGGVGGPGGSGGGIYSTGSLSVIASAVYANRAGVGGPGGLGFGGGQGGLGGAGGQGGSGGGLFLASGTMTVTNTTLAGNFAGPGGAGSGVASAGGPGGSGGAIAVVGGDAVVRDATLDGDGIGSGGASGATAGSSGVGGGLFVQSARLSLENTIVASSVGLGCAGAAIADGGHNLSWGDESCPGRRDDPKLGPLQDNGGPTKTMAIAAGSAALDRVPRRRGGCPAADQRGVRRPQGRKCDIGAYEFATPTITFIAPSPNGSYRRGARILARFRCDDGGVATAIAACKGSVAPGRAIGTRHVGRIRFVVTAIGKSGNRARKTIHYEVWQYVNPLREVSGLTPRRIDLGVDYAGWGPLLAIGRARVTMASDTDSGPPSCWAISCWPGGGIVVYRLLDGPFAGRYVYVAEHITVNVRAGETVSAGQRIATLYPGYPWSEWGWAAGPGPEALAMADGHLCRPCSDPGDWSTVEGRNMNQLLVGLGAPSGLLQATPSQSMPPGWPRWPGL